MLKSRLFVGLICVVAASGFAQYRETEPGVVFLKGGIKVKMLRDGDGPSPTELDTVKVNYRGTLPDNSEFETSPRGEPATVQLRSTIKCWNQGVQQMRAGGKAWIYCPAETAYGKKGSGTKVPPNAALEFEIELVEVIRGK